MSDAQQSSNLPGNSNLIQQKANEESKVPNEESKVPNDAVKNLSHNKDFQGNTTPTGY